MYRPGSDEGPHARHKTAHHARDRLALIGPRARESLRPYLGVEPGAYSFGPAAGEAARAAERRKARQTPPYPSHLRRLAAIR